jgi:hypothetical protein
MRETFLNIFQQIVLDSVQYVQYDLRRKFDANRNLIKFSKYDQHNSVAAALKGYVQINW